MELPIVCTLTESELRERRKTMLDAIRSHAIEVVELKDGYCYRFDAGPDVIARLSKLIELESQCCQFLTFKLIVSPQQPIALEVSGPPAAKAMISDFFGR